MKSYGTNKVSGDAGSAAIVGEGGATAALGRNPNELSELNGMPEGPLSSQLGFKGDGGMTSESLVKGFHFK